MRDERGALQRRLREPPVQQGELRRLRLACQTPGNGGDTACVSGVCQPTCSAPLGLCNARTDAGASGLACTDTSFDPVNCGACGQVCAPQQTCTAGQCTSCPSGELQCPTKTPGHTACKAVLSDNLNCGGCGAVCASPSSCQNGACVAPGLSNCGNASGGPALQKDLQNDPLNCGACGNACLASEVCRVGSCNGCPGAACANLCVDLAADPRNCGVCATACTGTQACVGGKCAQPVKLAITNPTQPMVPTGPLSLTARVDSALPMQSVSYVSILSDGGDSPPLPLNFDPSLNPVGVPTSAWASYLQPASDTSTGVLALRFDGTALDRFDCSGGAANCNRTPYVSTTGTFKLASVTVATAKTVLFVDAAYGGVGTFGTAQYLIANNPAAAPGGSAPVVAQPSPGTLVFPYSGTSLGATSAYAQSSGAVVFYTQASSNAGPYQLRIAHPNISGGSQALGPSHAGAPVFLQVFPSGEIVWQYLDGAGGSVLQAAYYDGTSAAAKVTNPSPQLAITASHGWQLVRPQMLLGLAFDKTSGLRELIQIDINRSGGRIAAPSPISTTVGSISRSVRNRSRFNDWYTVSDDQRKAIYVTSDPGPLLTLWLLDLVGGAANQLYSTATLDNADAAPRFVHSAAGAVATVPAAMPSTGLAQVPAILWGEDLATAVYTGAGNEFQPMRLFYALYKADGSVPPPVAVDRFAYAVKSYGALPLAYTVESSVGATLLFLSGSSSEVDLYSVPLTGSGTSSLVIDRPSGYLLREDKGRFLVQRSDGITFAGKLQAGTNPASTLVPIGTGGYGGPISVYSYFSSLTTFGFSADGDHAWTTSNFASYSETILRFVDLGTLAHQNLGAESSRSGRPGLGITPERLPCFLGNASFVIGVSSLAKDAVFSGLGALFAAPTASGLHQDLGLPTFFIGEGGLPICQLSIDGTEALVTGYPTTAAVVLSGGSVSATNLPSAGIGGPAQVSGYSPFGGPYLDEYDVIRTNRSGSYENFFKVWGENAAGGGKPFPFVPVAVGGTLAASTARPADLNTALLLVLQLSGAPTVPGAIPIAVPLAGKVAPTAPLP